jgi:hypothetical protein
VQSGGSSELALEKHFSVPEVAALWNVSRQTATRMFEGQPGVLSFGSSETRFGRKHITLRIPSSVVARVHRENRIK